VYVEYPAAAKEPPRQLRAFVKTSSLAPQSSEAAAACLTRAAFSVWDETSHAWAVVAGEYTLHVGASVADIRLQTSVDLF